MRMNRCRYYTLTVLLSVFLSSCGSTPNKSGSDGTGSGGANASGVVVGDALGENVDPDSIAGRAPKNRTIYFDFDSSDIQAEYREVIAEHGRYLARNQEGRVRLEGHTDERGTREYNIALGETRAKAVGRILQFQGVSSAQFRAITYGEELPEVDGHTPSAWEKNRRVNIVYEIE